MMLSPRSLLRRLALILFASSSLATPKPAATQTLVNNVPITNPFANGLIDHLTRAIVRSGNTVYVGGTFDYLGPPNGSAVLVDPTTGSVSTSFPAMPADCLTSAPDGSGGWYVGTGSVVVAGQQRYGLVHIRSDFTVDPDFAPQILGGVSSIAVSGSSVFFGGYFTQVNGTGRRNLAAVDATTGSLLPFNPSITVNPEIDALAVSGSTLFVGGLFSSMGGQPRQNFAALDATTGNALSWSADANSTVFALALDGVRLYVGGSFSGLAGFVRNRIGALVAATGALETWAPTWNPDVNGQIHALAVQGGVLYAGGVFASTDVPARNNLAAFSTTTGALAAWNSGTDFAVLAVSAQGGIVYVGGDFTKVGGVKRLRLAAIDPSGAVTGWNPAANRRAQTVVATSSGVLAGGSFTSAGGKARNGLGAFDATTGAVTSWDPNPDGPVYCLATDGTTVYVGGSFANIGGQARSQLAAVSAATGLATSWAANCDALVRDVALNGGVLYVGGDFATISGQGRLFAGAVNASTAAVTAWNPGANGTVQKILPMGSSVFVAGSFTSIGGQARTGVAQLNTTNGQPTSWNAGANAAIQAMATDGTALYMAGGFTQLGGALRSNCGAVDLATAVATSFNPSASAPPKQLLVSGSHLYATVSQGLGSPVTIGGQSRIGVAELNLPSGTATAWNPAMGSGNMDQSALWVSGSILYVGGTYPLVDAQQFHHDKLAAFDLSLVIGVGDQKPAFGVRLSPNPAGRTARIRLDLPRAVHVRVGVYDLQGRQVARLADEIVPAGAREWTWDTAAGSRSVHDGVYFVRVEAGSRVAVERLVLLH